MRTAECAFPHKKSHRHKPVAVLFVTAVVLPLFLQHLDYAGEVFCAMSAQAVRSVQRTGQAAQGGAGFDGGGVFLRQAQVFEHQVGAKAAGVALAGRGSFVHARVGVVLFQGPVAPRAAAHDFGQHFGIEAVGHAQGHGLAGADHQDA